MEIVFNRLAKGFKGVFRSEGVFSPNWGFENVEYRNHGLDATPIVADFKSAFDYFHAHFALLGHEAVAESQDPCFEELCESYVRRIARCHPAF